MSGIRIEKLDEVFVRLFSDEPSTEMELVQFFTYEYPGAKFTPKFRARLWDGLVRLYNPLTKTLPVGLVSYVEEYATNNGHTIEHLTPLNIGGTVNVGLVELYMQKLNLHGRGAPLELRDYQIDAVHTAIDRDRTLLISPTGSGKSLIIYTLMRWHIQAGRKCIIVVPNTSLVEQLYADFEDYSSANEWNVDDHCQKLYSGFTKEFSKDCLITTWQSAYLQPKNWFSQFDATICDEAHQAKASSVTLMMGKMDSVKYRIGTTGTLDNKKIHKLQLEGMFGRSHKVTTTKTLMDSGKLAPLNTTCLVLNYDQETRERMKKADYQIEMDWIVANNSRNKFIRNLTLGCKGTTLLLFQYVEKHGKVLHDMIQERCGDRKVYYVHGNVDVTDREIIKKAVLNDSNAIIVASFGTYSTGLNLPNIENVIFASPSKSKIRNLQSIGRGLRMSEGKVSCNLYDIADNLSIKSWKNHTLRHAAERYKTYAEEEFKIKIVEVSINN